MKRSVDEGGEQQRHPKKSWLCLLVGYYPVKDGDDRDNILVLWRWLINMDGIGDMETIFTEAKFTKAGWSWIQLEISGSNKVPTKDAQSKTLTKMTLFPLSFCSTELNKRPITWPMFPPQPGLVGLSFPSALFTQTCRLPPGPCCHICTHHPPPPPRPSSSFCSR